MGVTPDRVWQALLTAWDLSKGCGLRPFLMCGTALGAHRDGGPAPGDDDVDLGFLAEDFVPRAGELAKRLVDAGHPCSALVSPFTRCWAIKATVGGVGVDLVSYAPWADQAHGDDCRFAPSSYLAFCGCYPRGMLDRLSPVVVGDRRFVMPAPEEYLAWEYGPDWRTPKREHAYHAAGGRSRFDGFLATRGVPAGLLERF